MDPLPNPLKPHGHEPNALRIGALGGCDTCGDHHPNPAGPRWHPKASLRTFEPDIDDDEGQSGQKRSMKSSQTAPQMLNQPFPLYLRTLYRAGHAWAILKLGLGEYCRIKTLNNWVNTAAGMHKPHGGCLTRWYW